MTFKITLSASTPESLEECESDERDREQWAPSYNNNNLFLERTRMI